MDAPAAGARRAATVSPGPEGVPRSPFPGFSGLTKRATASVSASSLSSRKPSDVGVSDRALLM